MYARVSSSDQRVDLDRQAARLLEYATANKLVVTKTVMEVASGMNGRRPALRRLLADPSIHVIVVEHRDRLMRFGFEFVESALTAQGRRLMVMDEAELDDDLVRDMTEVLTSFCARLYGRRSAAARAKRALACAQEQETCA